MAIILEDDYLDWFSWPHSLFSGEVQSFFKQVHSVHWGINPPLFLAKLPLNLQTIPFLGNPSYILVSRETPPPLPPVKLGLSHEPPKYQSFSSWNPSYLLKVTKFLVKISQFEFLVTTEQRILLYKLFLSLNIPVFNLFFVKKLQGPLKKSHPASSDSPLKTEVLSSPPF